MFTSVYFSRFLVGIWYDRHQARHAAALSSPLRRPRLVPDGTNIPFFRYRWIAFGWSLFVLVATIILVADQRPGGRRRFKGGVLLEVKTPSGRSRH